MTASTRGAQYFANPDFFSALGGGKEGQAQKTETGDEYGKTRKNDKGLPKQLVILMLPVKLFIQEIIVEKVAGEKAAFG